MVLDQFIKIHREQILLECRQRASTRNGQAGPSYEMEIGLPVFLNQLCESLRRPTAHASVDHAPLRVSAGLHGEALFLRGLTVEQLVHDYGDLCQVITSLAGRLHEPIAVEDFKILNLSLDDAIAGAVSEFERNRQRVIVDASHEQLGVLAHKLRNLSNVATLAFEAIRKGTVPPAGSTGEVLQRTLMQLNGLIDRSLAEMRLDSTADLVGSLPVWELIEEVAIGARVLAASKGHSLVVSPVEPDWTIQADVQILAAAISNLLQNAFKFTKPGSTVWLRTSLVGGRILIAVEDQCGGLPPGTSELLLAPHLQRGNDHSGLGLGLSICMKAMAKMGGSVIIHDRPGEGCIFTLNIPAESGLSAQIL